MQKQTDYFRANRTKYPEPVVIAVAKDKNGKPNPVTVGWSMTASGNPPMIAIALAHTRYTTEAIRHSKCFNIAFPSSEMAELAMFFGTNSGRDVDKFAETSYKTSPAKKIDSVIIDDAVANFECSLESEMIAGDHVIFVGRVLCSHINTETKKRLYITGPGHQLGAVS